MKTILACTDFSPGGDHAVKFAAALASATGADLHLLHICRLPVVTGEMPLAAYGFEEIEEDARKRLQALADSLSFPKHVHVKCVTGLAVDVILEEADDMNADLIISGTRGQTNGVGFLGGIVYDLMHFSKRPVLGVPGDINFHPPKVLLLASDLGKEEHPEYELLRKLINNFNARLILLSIMKPGEKPDVKKAIAGVTLEHDFSDVTHDFEIGEDDDFEHGIKEAIAHDNADWLVLMPHRHNVLRRLFGNTHTQRLLKNVEVPLLTLPAK